jgi:3-hydroxyisobutyrate dehydrogenase-like beta-hydroxyacid dehydrogenase
VLPLPGTLHAGRRSSYPPSPRPRASRRRNRSKAHLAGQPFLLDINSVSPGRKQETAKLLGDSARYVDVAVLAPIHPARHQTPMLLAGPHAAAVAPMLAALGMRTTIAGAEVGAAAAIKMVRGVIVKGIEALTLECFLAAARAGVVDEVANSLKNNYPGLDWSKIVPYNLERMAVHGERRAAEMEEVAETLRELGVEPLMTLATVKRQREMGQVGTQATVREALGQGRTAILSAISATARDRH